MKKWLVHASSMSYYTLEVAAETEEKALEIANDTDGGAWKELDDRGDWEIEKAEEIKRFDIPSFISVYDWAGQLVHSQDGKGYLDK